MTTSWAGLSVSARRGKRCATDSCKHEPVWTMTSGDVSSDYCDLCREQIVCAAYRTASDALDIAELKDRLAAAVDAE